MSPPFCNSIVNSAPGADEIGVRNLATLIEKLCPAWPLPILALLGTSCGNLQARTESCLLMRLHTKPGTSAVVRTPATSEPTWPNRGDNSRTRPPVSPMNLGLTISQELSEGLRSEKR